jgi:hypothetical protein
VYVLRESRHHLHAGRRASLLPSGSQAEDFLAFYRYHLCGCGHFRFPAALPNWGVQLTDEERDKIFHALLGDVSMLAPKDPARVLLEEVAARMLEDIAPVLNTIIERRLNQKGTTT